MNTAFFLKNAEKDPRWHVIDASDKVLGRLCTEIADLLRGKGKAIYTPSMDAGDYVVITNCEKIKLTGDKLRSKIYTTYSGYRSGIKEIAARDLLAKQPERLIELGVRGMLPKTKMGRAMIKKLRVYIGSAHPHEAQIRGFGK